MPHETLFPNYSMFLQLTLRARFKIGSLPICCAKIHLQMYFIGFPVASLVDQSGQDVERGLCFVGIYFSLQHIFDLSSVFIGETVPVEGLMVIFSSGLKKTTALPHRA